MESNSGIEENFENFIEIFLWFCKITKYRRKYMPGGITATLRSRIFYNLVATIGTGMGISIPYDLVNSSSFAGFGITNGTFPVVNIQLGTVGIQTSSGLGLGPMIARELAQIFLKYADIAPFVTFNGTEYPPDAAILAQAIASVYSLT